MNKHIPLLLITLTICLNIRAQKSEDKIILSYETIIGMAQEKSVAALSGKTERENAYWQYKSFKATFLPRLDLSASLPNWNNVNTPVTQSDGSISYEWVNQSSSRLGLNASQLIAPTGGRFYINTDLDAFYNFKNEQTNYNYAPVNIGFNQPLFKFNEYPWNKKIEESRFLESEKEFYLNQEQININATRLFFNLMLSQIGKEIAQKNLENNDTILKMARGRYDLGKIAENDLLQIELSHIRSEQELDQANINIANQEIYLKNYIGLKDTKGLLLLLPETILDFDIDFDVAIKKAKQNRPEVLRFERQLLEAERNFLEAKRNSRLNADLYLQFGLSATSQDMASIVDNVGQAKSANIILSVPILDWGRSKSDINRAKATKLLTEYNIEQERITFEEEIYSQLNSFTLLKKQVEIAKRADEIAQKRYDVIKNRYMIGNITITNMNLATQEKDAAKKSYIDALKNYWQGYYNLRKLTLYDFMFQRDIIPSDNNENT